VRGICDGSPVPGARPLATAAPRRSRTADAAALVAGATLVAWGWSFNARVVGELYDYGIVVDGAYLLGRGWRPHVDVPMPIGSLVLHLARVCEAVFGDRYLALAYGNLLFALALFVGLFALLRRSYGPWLSGAAAVALCAAIPLQHGILWYNSIAAAALVVAILVAAHRAASAAPRRIDAVLLLGAVWILGMVKANGFALGIVVALAGVVAGAIRAPAARRVGAELGGLAAAVALVPLAETWLSGCTVAEWYDDVFVRPAPRARAILRAASDPAVRRLVLWGDYNDFYLGAGGHALVGMALVATATLVVVLAWRATGRGRCIAVLLAATGWLVGVAHVVSNFEIPVLRATPFLAVVLALPVAAGGRRPYGAATTAVLAAAIAWCGVVAGPSIANHARLRYGTLPSGTFRPPSAAWPTHYFDGVAIGDLQWRQIDRVYAFLAGRAADDRTGFFGPSLGSLHRLTGSVPPRGLPLWWHHDLTWSAAHDAALVVAFRAADPAFVAYNWWGRNELAPGIRNDVAARYRRVEDDPEIWVRAVRADVVADE